MKRILGQDHSRIVRPVLGTSKKGSRDCEDRIRQSKDKNKCEDQGPYRVRIWG
jgi:hypothetical protein